MSAIPEEALHVRSIKTKFLIFKRKLNQKLNN